MISTVTLTVLLSVTFTRANYVTRLFVHLVIIKYWSKKTLWASVWFYKTNISCKGYSLTTVLKIYYTVFFNSRYSRIVKNANEKLL